MDTVVAWNPQAMLGRAVGAADLDALLHCPEEPIEACERSLHPLSVRGGVTLNLKTHFDGEHCTHRLLVVQNGVQGVPVSVAYRSAIVLVDAAGVWLRPFDDSDAAGGYTAQLLKEYLDNPLCTRVVLGSGFGTRGLGVERGLLTGEHSGRVEYLRTPYAHERFLQYVSLAMDARGRGWSQPRGTHLVDFACTRPDV